MSSHEIVAPFLLWFNSVSHLVFVPSLAARLNKMFAVHFPPSCANLLPALVRLLFHSLDGLFTHFQFDVHL